MPLVAVREVPSDLKAGRKSRRRLERVFRSDQMVNGCIKALNSLYSGGQLDSAKSSSAGMSLAQQTAVKHITNSVQQLGAPPDLTGAEALRQLRAFDGYGDDQAPCAVKPYDSSLLSLPEHGSKAVPLHQLSPEKGPDGVDLATGPLCEATPAIRGVLLPSSCSSSQDPFPLLLSEDFSVTQPLSELQLSHDLISPEQSSKFQPDEPSCRR